MTRFKFFLFSLLVSSLLTTGAVSAESVNSYHAFRAKIIGASGAVDWIPAKRSLSALSAPKKELPNIRLTAFVPGLGRIRIHFNKERRFKAVPTYSNSSGVAVDAEGVTLLRGRIKQKNKEGPAAGSIFYVNDTPYLFIAFVGKNSRYLAGKYYKLRVPLAGSSSAHSFAVVRRVSKYAITARFEHDMLLPAGGVPHLESALAAEMQLAQTDISQGASLRAIELNLDADKQWHAIYGSNSNSTISSYVNEAEAIYESQLGMTFEVVRQNVFTNRSFGTSNAESKIFAYQDYTLGQSYYGNADANHLFTGDTINNNIIGISYVGVICTQPHNTFGFTQSTTSSFTPITFAHELGHNFSATHDDNGKSIMNTVIANPPPESFSDFSINQITSFVNNYGSCLAAQVEPTPTPGPTIPVTLSGRLTKKGSFSATISLVQAYPECTVTLYGSPKKNKVFTKGKALASYSALEMVTTLQGKLKKKARKTNNKGTKTKTYIGAEIVCPDGTLGQSAKKRIKPQQINSSKELSVASWLKQLSKKL